MLKVIEGDLQKAGHVIVDPTFLIDPKVMGRVIEVATLYRFQWIVYSGGSWHVGLFEWKIKKLFKRIVGGVKKLVPKERFVLDRIYVRISNNETALGNSWHIDDDYLVMVYVIRGIGTRFVNMSVDSPRVDFVPEKSAIIMSGFTRQEEVGVQSVLHAAPSKVVGGRAVILITFKKMGVVESPMLSKGLGAEQERCKKELSSILEKSNTSG